MGRTTAHRLRSLDVRTVLAAVAIAAMAAAPAVVFAESIHPTKTMVSADPDEVDWYYIPDGGAGGGG
jgi:hypothetical protein